MRFALGATLALAACAPVPVDPRSEDAFGQGMEAFLAGDFERASELLDAVPEGHPYDQVARTARFQILVSDFARDLEAGSAELAAAHVGDDPWNAGMRAYYLHQYPEAVRQLARVPATQQEYAKAMRFAGYNVFVREWGRAADALPYLARAYRAAPDDPKVVEDAERGFEKAGHAFPPDEATLARLAEMPLPAPPPDAPAGPPAGAAGPHAGTGPTPDSRPEGERTLSREDAEADLLALRVAIAEQFAYATRVDLAWEAELTALTDGLEPAIPLRAFAFRLQRFLARFGDGHTGVRVPTAALLPLGYAPVLFGDASGRVFAFQADRRGLVDSEHPYVVEIDGVSVEDWVEAAATIVPAGAPHFVRFHAVRNLRYVGWLRTELALPAAGPLRLTLTSADLKRRTEVSLPLAPRKPDYGNWPRTATRRLDGDIGYLRIAEMRDEDAYLAGLDRAMAGFRDTRGLVIDVRGNGGGSREALRRLFPYFLLPDDSPRIANVAAPRGTGCGPEGVLEDRFLWPATASRWNAETRRHIEAFLAAFTPEWTPPAGQFGPWHVMLLERALNTAAYVYDRPVVVLMDAGCFSATDVFCGAFKGWRNVTLLGTPSGGGSGRARAVRLSHSGLEVRLSSMASFQPTGQLYDGRGVEPDVRHEPAPEDSTTLVDTALDAACFRLRAARR